MHLYTLNKTRQNIYNNARVYLYSINNTYLPLAQQDTNYRNMQEFVWDKMNDAYLLLVQQNITCINMQGLVSVKMNMIL